jgi:hypothetical protein
MHQGLKHELFQAFLQLVEHVSAFETHAHIDAVHYNNHNP